MKYATNLSLLFLSCSEIFFAQPDNAQIISGFRASRILSNYPNIQFPSPQYWGSAGEFISNKFTNSTPSAIWIVSLYLSNGYTQLTFANPFNPQTSFYIYLPNESVIKCSVNDINGKKVAELFNGVLAAGKHLIYCNAENFCSGIYFVKTEYVNNFNILSYKLTKLCLIK